MLRTVVLAVCLLSAACDGSLSPDLESTPDAGAGSLKVRNPTFAGPNELLFMVKVHTHRGVCSGVAIARDRVLTAAHCLCEEAWVDTPECWPDVSVAARPDPATGIQPGSIRGRATAHPSYNPSWVDAQIKHDLAVVDLDAPLPAYVPALAVSTTMASIGGEVVLAGFGRSGSDCDVAPGPLATQVARVSDYEEGGQILRFNDRVWCDGDSGGAILDIHRTKVMAIISSEAVTLSHGWVNKAIATPYYHPWIKGLTCSATLEDVCDGSAPMCRCRAGVGDCDSAGDCEAGLQCRQDVGASFGYPATTDVCAPAGPVGGTCRCGGVLGGLCTTATNGCSAGYRPVCNPSRREPGVSCGGCSCVR
jgi:hypothetical protein